MEKTYFELKILSLNCAGWGWKVNNVSWQKRLRSICVYLKQDCDRPFAIALQEVQLAGGKYIPTIREYFPEAEYFMVLPKAWNRQPKSAVSLLLLNKKYVRSFSVMELPRLEDSLRYNFLTVITNMECLVFRILNVHVPQTTFDKGLAPWYMNSRIALKETFLNALLNEAKTYAHEPDLKFIMLGDLNSSPDDPFVQSIAYRYSDMRMFDAATGDYTTPTWTNNGGKNRLDYLLYSAGMLVNTGVGVQKTVIDQDPIRLEYSDHALLSGGLLMDSSIYRPAQAFSL